MADFEARLFGAAMAAGVAAGAIVWSGSPLADALRPDGVRMARMTACNAGGATFTAEFAPISDILSLTPMGYDLETGAHGRLGVKSRRGDHPSERRDIGAFAAADGAVVRVAGDPRSGYAVDLQPCDGLLVRYEGLQRISPKLAAIRDGAADDLLVSGGDRLGSGPGFNLVVADLSGAPRYERRLGVSEARVTQSAKCPLDVMPSEMRAEFSEKLGDEWGLRKARGERSCGSIDLSGEDAVGAWKSDASDGMAIAFAEDAFKPGRLVMKIGGETSPIAHHMVDLPRADLWTRLSVARADFVFEEGARRGRVNILPTSGNRSVHCLEGLESAAGGARIDAVALVAYGEDEDGLETLSFEMRADADRCSDLKKPWRFSAAKTEFHR
ncbi:MAG: hypothetical protein AAFR11_07965 [Pseudomonadota bacterium]